MCTSPLYFILASAILYAMKVFLSQYGAQNIVVEAFGKHSIKLVVFLSKQLHFAVLLHLCFVNRAPARIDFQPFPR